MRRLGRKRRLIGSKAMETIGQTKRRLVLESPEDEIPIRKGG